MKWMSSDSPAAPGFTPDTLMNKLNPVLGMSKCAFMSICCLIIRFVLITSHLLSESKSFVLDLWKYIHISRLQSEHGIQDSTVEDIAPLTAAVLLHRPDEEETEEESPSISERVKVQRS